MAGWSNPSANTRTLTRYERQKFHDAVFARSSTCAHCGQQATIADHVTPIAFGGAHDPELNGQPLCKLCSDTKTRPEIAEGRRRANQQRGTSKRAAEVHPGLRRR